jgi:hypothetical protein
MARRRGGGGPSRMDLRRQNEAAESRESEDEVEEVEDDDEEGDDDEADAEAEVDAEVEAVDEDAAGDDDEDAPKPKKSRAKAKAKTPKEPKAKAPSKRTRAVKEVRMKAIWVVMDNGSKRVKEFAFNQKAEAEAFLAEKTEEKKGNFYIQLIKEQMEA